MFDISKLISLISILFILNISACASTTNNKIERFNFPTESFVQIQTKLYTLSCTPSDPDDKTSNCRELIESATGSGAIIARSVDGSYILTAGHLCNRKDNFENFNKMMGRSLDQPIIEEYVAKDIDMFDYNVEILDYDVEQDVCLAYAWGLLAPALEIAEKAPEIGEKVYNMAAPAGYMMAGAVPLFEGYYFGKGPDYDLYTVPAIGGSSGSPIVNSNGQLVGMIYARHTHFHHITISPVHKKMVSFILEGMKKDATRRNKIHNVPRGKGLKINISY